MGILWGLWYDWGGFIQLLFYSAFVLVLGVVNMARKFILFVIILCSLFMVSLKAAESDLYVFQKNEITTIAMTEDVMIVFMNVVYSYRTITNTVLYFNEQSVMSIKKTVIEKEIKQYFWNIFEKKHYPIDSLRTFNDNTNLKDLLCNELLEILRSNEYLGDTVIESMELLLII